MVRNVDLPDQAVPPQFCRTGSLLPPENKNLSLSNVSLAMLHMVPRSIRIILCFRGGLTFYCRTNVSGFMLRASPEGKQPRGKMEAALRRDLGKTSLESFPDTFWQLTFLSQLPSMHVLFDEKRSNYLSYFP